MTDTFEDLKIEPALLAGVEALGWDAPSGLQRDALAVIRRGNNVVLHASPGSGATGAYGLGILDRLIGSDDETGDPAVLILVPDAHAASATAESLARMAAPAGLVVRALGPGWTTGSATVLVAPPSTALAAVRGSELKLDGISSIVIQAADLLTGTSQWSDVETLVDTVPGGAQRVLVTGRLDPAMDGFAERHVRKAMTVPPRSDPREAPAGAAGVRYAVVPESGKPTAAAHLVAAMTDDQVAVVCRTVDRAEEASRALTARGLMGAGNGPDLVVLPRQEADQRSIQAGVLSYDVPFDADELNALHSGGGAVLVTPRERSHLLRIAVRAGLRVEAVATPAAPPTAVDEVRNTLRELVGQDLTAELALLEPLLAELPAAEVAAAAMRMAGSAPPRSVSQTDARPGPSDSPVEAVSTPGRAAAPPPDTGTWVHLFMTVGSRDGVGPGDIVGAITGEAGVGGDKVGKIDIRESHSTVEVATGVAGQVIDSLNGRSLKGRSLRVDYDRKDRAPREPGGGGSGRAAGDRRPGGRGSGGRGPGGRRPRD